MLSGAIIGDGDRNSSGVGPGAGENTPIAPGTFLYTYVPTIDDVTSGPKAYNFSHERENQT